MAGGAKVLDKLPVSGRSTILITVGQGPTALAVGAGMGCLDNFILIYPFSPLFPSFWETVRYTVLPSWIALFPRYTVDYILRGYTDFH